VKRKKERKKDREDTSDGYGRDVGVVCMENVGFVAVRGIT